MNTYKLAKNIKRLTLAYAPSPNVLPNRKSAVDGFFCTEEDSDATQYYILYIKKKQFKITYMFFSS